MQYKIPQNVGIEDKIVGPLTLRQLIIVAVGVGISWVLFAILGKLYELNIIEYVIIALPGLLSIAFAMIRINDLPLSKYILLLMEFSMKPKRRMWDHRGIANLVAPDLWEPLKAEVPGLNAAILEKSKKAANLRQLSLVLDSGGFGHVKEVQHRDIDVAQDDNLVVEAYFGNDDREKMNMYWRTLESHKKRLSFFAKLPVTQLKAGTQEVEIAKIEIAKAKAEADVARKAAMGNRPPKQPLPQARPSAPSVTTPQPQAPLATPKPKLATPTPIRNASLSSDVARPQENVVKAHAVPLAQPTAKQPLPAEPAATTPSVPKAPTSNGTQAPKPTASEKPTETPRAAPQAPMAPSSEKPKNLATPPSRQAGPSAQPQKPASGSGKKQPPQPVRTGHVNTTQKNAPAQYLAKTPPPTKTTPPPKPQQTATPSAPTGDTQPKPPVSQEKTATPPIAPDAGSKAGEFKFEELKKGEIEINLD